MASMINKYDCFLVLFCAFWWKYFSPKFSAWMQVIFQSMIYAEKYGKCKVSKQQMKWKDYLRSAVVSILKSFYHNQAFFCATSIFSFDYLFWWFLYHIEEVRRNHTKFYTEFFFWNFYWNWFCFYSFFFKSSISLKKITANRKNTVPGKKLRTHSFANCPKCNHLLL